MNWYLVCCLSGHERRAADDIAHDLAFETFCPQLHRIKLVRGARARVVSALFQGYAFARFDRERDDWGRINAIDGVLGIYRHENLPVSVPEAEVRIFQNAEKAGVFDLTSSAANFRTPRYANSTRQPAPPASRSTTSAAPRNTASRSRACSPAELQKLHINARGRPDGEASHFRNRERRPRRIPV